MRRPVRRLVIFLGVFLGLTLAAAGMLAGIVLWQAQGLTPPIPENATVGEIAALLVEEQRVPSISYAIVEAGTVVDQGTFGVTDVSTGEVATNATLYEAASLTKPIVAELAARLYDQGLFKLEESVADTLGTPPRIKDELLWSRVTPRHLLAHLSGLPNWAGDHQDADRQDALTFAMAPGVKFTYSGEAYGLLLTFLEMKSGKSARELSDALFRDAGMTQSTLIAADFEGTYARGHWGMTPDRPARLTDRAVAAYSLITTAGDYGRFLAHVMTSPDISEATRKVFRKVYTPQSVPSGLPNGLGWSLGWGMVMGEGGNVYFQWGDNRVFRAFAGFDPATGKGIVYLTNGSFGTLYANELATPVLGDISPASNWFASKETEIVRRLIKM